MSTSLRSAPPSRAAAGRERGAVRAAVIVLLATNVLVALANPLRGARELALSPLTEDGFYALTVARNIALGNGMTIDGVLPTNGFQPLATFLNVLSFLPFGEDRIAPLRVSLLLSTVIWLAFAAVAALIARDRARRLGYRGEMAGVVALVVVLASVSVFRIFHNGLETGLHLLVLALAVLVLDRTERFDLRRALLLALLLALVPYARLDGALFVAAVGAVAVWRAARGRGQLVAPLLACALSALALVPWLARNVALDGHPVPTSGQAQAVAVDRAYNLEAGVRALGAWTAPPALRPRMHPDAGLWPTLGAVCALAAFALALVALRRMTSRAGPDAARRSATTPASVRQLGHGTAALWLYVGALFAFYTLAFGAWWFLDRYLAPMLLVTLPWVAAAVEALLARPAARPVLRRRALVGVLGAVALVNLPVAVVSLLAPAVPPAWASPRTNLGSHANVNLPDQTVPVMARLTPGCRVGATESGTLGYFRDGVVNLDGKVNVEALRAKDDLRGYVDRTRLDAFSGTAGAARRVLGRPPVGFTRVSEQGGYELWVRAGREAACLRGGRP